MSMQLTVMQTAHQRWLFLDLPMAAFSLDETEMLCSAIQYGFTALLDLVTDPVRVDVGNRAVEIDVRAPGRKRGLERQLFQAPAIALGCGTGETPAFAPWHFRDSSGDCEARSKPLHV